MERFTNVIFKSAEEVGGALVLLDLAYHCGFTERIKKSSLGEQVKAFLIENNKWEALDAR